MSMTNRLSAALLLAAAFAAPVPAHAQDGGTPTPPVQPPAPTKDAVAAQYLKDTKAKASKMADQDAKTAIKKLVEMWKDKEIADETKKPIPELLEQFGREEKTLVAIDAIDAIGELGTSGAAPALRILDRALGAKEPSVDIYGSCLRALKKLADQKKTTISALVDLLKHRMDDVVGKSADALGGYKEAPGKLRRELLEELIKNTEGTCAQAKDPKNAGQVRKWNIIQNSVISAINALSGQKFKDVQEARKWFNDHKKDKMWDA
jgi:HEAT repeat protein